MTLDEALKAFANVSEPSSFKDSVWIERFVALGILKLDEPKSAQQQFYDVIAAELAVDSPAMRNMKDNKHVVAMIFYDALKEAGLRIVEK